jgi:energy-coupling factor transporter transmembrane protein EcfT
MVPVTWLSVASLAAAPLGLAGPLWGVLEMSLTALNFWATLLAGLPGAEVWVSPPTALLLVLPCIFLLGLIYARRTAWAVAGLAVVLASLLIFKNAPPQLVAVQGGQRVLQHTPHGYVVLQGSPLTLGGLPGLPLAPAGTPRPTPLFTTLTTAPTPDDCAASEVIIAPEPGACPAQTLVTGRYAWATFSGQHGLKITQPRCARVWHRLDAACQTE